MICIANQVSRESLRGMPVPKREDVKMGRFWKPIAHSVVADSTVEALQKRGEVIHRETWGLCRKDLGLLGAIELDRPVDGMKTTLGIRQSLDGYWALKFVGGATVKICGNGLLCGDEILIHQMHVEDAFTDKSLGDTIHEALDTFFENSEGLRDIQREMQGFGLTRSDGDSFTCDMFREGTIPLKTVKRVTTEWGNRGQNSQYKWVSENGRFQGQVWDYFNVCTEAIRDLSPVNQFDTLRNVQEFVSTQALIN